MSTTTSVTSVTTGSCPMPGHGETAPQMTALGAVAESYDQLHRIDLIAQARADRGVASGSYESFVCAIFQAADVALLNLSRLADRTAAAVDRGDIATAARYAQWSVGFHRLLRHFGVAQFDARSAFGARPGPDTITVSIADSRSYRTFVDAAGRLDAVVNRVLLQPQQTAIRETIATKSIDDSLYIFLHCLRTVSHDATKWERDLTDVAIRSDRPRSVDELTSAHVLDEAVSATELNSATLHGEFVALHQIPEILCAEANDHLEMAIRAIRVSALSEAAEYLSSCRKLLIPVVESQRVMAELLATGEYHGFRENLGPASGTHSLAIKQHMFRDLFKCFWNDMQAWLQTLGEGNLAEAIRETQQNRHRDARMWLRHSVIDEGSRLHNVHQQWRHEHLHMPRNCLGSGGTKSMIGVPDGPLAVYKMRDAANSQRSLVAVHAARGVSLANSVPDSPLVNAITGDDSVDGVLMRLVGEATREYFPEVQDQGYKPFHSTAPERKP